MPFLIRVRKLLLRRDNISPNFVSYFTTQIRHGGKPTISTRYPYHSSIVCHSTQIRQMTCVNQLVEPYDSQSESSCLLLKPWLLHTSAFRRGGVVFQHTSYCYTPQVWQVLSYWIIQSCSRIHVRRCLGAVCLRSASFRSFVFVIPCCLHLRSEF